MLASGVLIGVIAGLALGRNWRRVTDLRIRWLALLLIGVSGRALAPLFPGAAFGLYVIAIASTTVVAGVNYRVVGAGLIAVGGLMNLTVVLANGGMPVDPLALSIAGATMPSDALHVAISEATRVRELGDIIALPITHSVYSAGDFLIAAGGFLVPFVPLLRR